MKFPDDYPIEVLRGRSRPSASNMRRILTKRLEWLKQKYAERAAGPDYDEVMDYTFDEMRTVAHILDQLKGED